MGNNFLLDSENLVTLWEREGKKRKGAKNETDRQCELIEANTDVCKKKGGGASPFTSILFVFVETG